MLRKKVILDVDTGSDDAVAIMTAVLSDDLDVLGITVTHGNQALPYTLDNTLRVVEMLGVNVPVYAGCSEPMVQLLEPSRVINAGEQKMEKEIDGKMVSIHERSLPLPPPTIKAQTKHACTFLVETLKASKEKITLIPVGPPTNIGMALRMDPSIAENIEEIVCMGGGVQLTNITKCAEINFFHDPEAAKIMLQCGAKVTIVPLDATHSAWFGYEEADKLKAIGNPAADFAGEMLAHRITTARQIKVRDVDKSALHDVLAVCAVIDSSVLTDVRHQSCDVDISGGIAEGQLVVDTRPVASVDKPTYVSYKADGDKLFSIMSSCLSNMGKNNNPIR